MAFICFEKEGVQHFKKLIRLGYFKISSTYGVQPSQSKKENISYLVIFKLGAQSRRTEGEGAYPLHP